MHLPPSISLQVTLLRWTHPASSLPFCSVPSQHLPSGDFATIDASSICHPNFSLSSSQSSSSQHLPSGDFVTIDASGILIAPLLLSLLHRRCIDPLDMAGVFLCTMGILLITKPTFLPFSSKKEPLIEGDTWIKLVKPAYYLGKKTTQLPRVTS